MLCSLSPSTTTSRSPGLGGIVLAILSFVGLGLAAPAGAGNRVVGLPAAGKPAAGAGAAAESGAAEPEQIELAVSTADGVELACTLTHPPASARPETGSPGAVLLTVAGPNDRNQSFASHQPYRVLANHLARRGIATLRCDDRGVGSSDGDWLQASYDTLAVDALAMVEQLASAPGVDPERVGIVGNSEGGAVAPLAARRAPRRVAFVVSLAGPGVSGEASLRDGLERAIASRGLPDSSASNLRAKFEELLEILGLPPDELAAREAMTRFLQTGGGLLIPPYAFVPRDLDGLRDFLLSPWYRSQLGYDPAAVVPEVQAPVLHLVGSKDTVLPPAVHHAAMLELLRERSDGSAARVVEGVNHLFQTAETGSPAEYATLEESFAPDVAAAVADWILQR